MVTSEQLDAAIKTEIQRHIQTGIDADNGSSFCSACSDLWPCNYLIQASISLKLTAIAILMGDNSALQLMAGGVIRGAQGNRDRFKGSKV